MTHQAQTHKIESLSQSDKETIDKCSSYVRDKLYDLEYYLDHDYELSKETIEIFETLIENANKLLKLIEQDKL